MTSDKIKSLKTLISLAQAGQMAPDRALLRIMQRSLCDIHEQVLALEAAQVPVAQRVTDEHLASGKVTLLAREVPFQ